MSSNIVTVRFSKTVTWVDALHPGVTITHDNGGTFTITGPVFTVPKNVISYQGSWDIPSDLGDVVTWDYSTVGGGDYTDGTDPMTAQTLLLTNCLDPTSSQINFKAERIAPGRNLITWNEPVNGTFTEYDLYLGDKLASRFPTGVNRVTNFGFTDATPHYTITFKTATSQISFSSNLFGTPDKLLNLSPNLYGWWGNAGYGREDLRGGQQSQGSAALNDDSPWGHHLNFPGTNQIGVTGDVNAAGFSPKRAGLLMQHNGLGGVNYDPLHLTKTGRSFLIHAVADFKWTSKTFILFAQSKSVAERLPMNNFLSFFTDRVGDGGFSLEVVFDGAGVVASSHYPAGLYSTDVVYNAATSELALYINGAIDPIGKVDVSALNAAWPLTDVPVSIGGYGAREGALELPAYDGGLHVDDSVFRDIQFYHTDSALPADLESVLIPYLTANPDRALTSGQWS